MTFDPSNYNDLTVTESPIPGLFVINLPVHGDNRGWFKENYQQTKMAALGLPTFDIVQNNISFNDKRGVTRGLHAEPWDKYISVANGSVFGAWVDIREGSPTYGTAFTVTINPGVAVFVPRGVANGFQTLEDNTAYTYLVNDHWSPEASYAFVSIYDEALGIDWPIALDEAEVSDKDKSHPLLADADSIKSKKILVTGANGQLGKALRTVLPEAEFVSRADFDISGDLSATRRWRDYGVIINAAGYTAVDAAETPEGRANAWTINATAVAQLARIADSYDITLVHVSSDYVFDGSVELHREDEALSPLGVYGQTKAAGDLAAATARKHYIVRTSWVIGDGNNFVRTMQSLAERGIAPSVVSDQIGRLTFTDELARGIKHLLDVGAAHGIYNLSGSGEPASWADIAKAVYEHAGKPASDVTPVTTAEYYAGKTGIAPRPRNSTLDLTKITKTGFAPRDWRRALTQYMV